MYLTTGWPFLPLPWAQPRGPQVRGLCSPLPCAALIIAYRADGVGTRRSGDPNSLFSFQK